jgi:hypothetical protein
VSTGVALLLLLPPHKIIRLALAGIRSSALCAARRHTHGDQRSLSFSRLCVPLCDILALARLPIDLHCGRPIQVFADSHTAVSSRVQLLSARTCIPTAGKLKWVSLCVFICIGNWIGRKAACALAQVKIALRLKFRRLKHVFTLCPSHQKLWI